MKANFKDPVPKLAVIFFSTKKEFMDVSSKFLPVMNLLLVFRACN